MTTIELQRRLADLGFSPGPIDGERGPLTTAAVKEFQRSRGLAADGIVGPLTLAALTAPASSSGDTTPIRSLSQMPWFAEATRLLGVKEGPGAANNPIIMDWADDLDLHYPADSVAWCGLFVGYCVGSELPHEKLPANPLGARTWQGFGQPVSLRNGCVVVFWRGERDGWQGHVGFCAGERSDAILTRGGNQSDSVSDAWVSKSRLLATRWPLTAPIVDAGTKPLTGGAGWSTSEA